MSEVKEKTKAEATPVEEKMDPATGEVVQVNGGLPAEYAGYEADEGAGFENQTSEDVGIPWVALLQQMSPEVLAEGSEAKMGMWVNRGSGELYPDGLTFIPCLTKHVFREWPSKDPSGGAPVADHDIDSELVIRVRRDQPFGDYTHPDNPDHPLIETFDVYGIALTKEGLGLPAICAFTSTGIKAYKDMILRARSVQVTLPNGRKINPPLFAHAYSFRSKRVEKKPHVWAVPVIGFADPAGAEKSRLTPDSDLYQQARSLREAITSGAAKAAAPQRGDAGGDAPLEKGDVNQEKAPY